MWFEQVFVLETFWESMSEKINNCLVKRLEAFQNAAQNTMKGTKIVLSDYG